MRAMGRGPERPFEPKKRKGWGFEMTPFESGFESNKRI
jgi:hypothetical protein